MRNKKILLLSLALLGVVGTSIGMNSYQNVVNKAEAAEKLETKEIYFNTEDDLLNNFEIDAAPKEELAASVESGSYFGSPNSNYLHLKWIKSSKHYILTTKESFKNIEKFEFDYYVNNSSNPKFTIHIGETEMCKDMNFSSNGTNMKKNLQYTILVLVTHQLV